MPDPKEQETMNHDDYKHYAIPIHAAATKPTTWQPAIDAHCLVAGGSEAERTNLISDITADFTAAGWSVQRGDSIEKQQEIITDTWVLMEQRYNQHISDPAAREEWDPILLVVGEECSGVPQTEAAARGVPDQVRDLLCLARSAKIHVLVCASTQTAELLTAEMRDNLTVRVPVDAATRDHQLLQV